MITLLKKRRKIELFASEIKCSRYSTFWKGRETGKTGKKRPKGGKNPLLSLRLEPFRLIWSVRWPAEGVVFRESPGKKPFFV